MPPEQPLDWRDVEIWEACLSWQQCECGMNMLFCWDEGKDAGLTPTCPTCGKPTEVVVVTHTAN